MKKLIAISILTLIGFNAFANDNAKKFIEGFINEDIAAFRTPNESMIGDEILWVSASILNGEFPVLKDCVTADSYFQKYFEMTMNNMSQLKEEDTPKDILECSYLALKEFDIKNPGKLDEIELDNDDPDYVRETFYPVLSFLKEYTEKYNEVCKVFTMPNP